MIIISLELLTISSLNFGFEVNDGGREYYFVSPKASQCCEDIPDLFNHNVARSLLWI